ncbi:MAG TPA: FIST N-terminal domain-containing protein [Candidatus Polarisedimenticolaceae bacterium]|nr:FIST N-terminal domain-containing protein [Candidatus Polarisedimenticolaceae bacterium]
MIEAGVGLSSASSTVVAASEAASTAASGLSGGRADLAIVFATGDHADEIPSLLSSVERAAGTPYIVGCSAAGVIAQGREVEDGPAIGVLAIRSDVLRTTPFLFRDSGDQGLTAGIHLGQRLAGSRATEDVVLVWPDPFRVRPDRMLQGLDATLGAVPVAGGAASSVAGASETFQFNGCEAGSGAVSGVRLAGGVRHQVAVTQGCRPLGEPVRVTGAHENLVLELDGMPALEALRKLAPQDPTLDPEASLASLSVALLPEGAGGTLRPGEYLVRNILAVDPDTGVIAVAAAVEEGQSLLFAIREPEAARADVERMARRAAAAAPLGGYDFGLYFNCLARGRSLYGREGVDAGILSRYLGDVPILGFFCNAEIAPVSGMNHLFTYTGVLVLFSA